MIITYGISLFCLILVSASVAMAEEMEVPDPRGNIFTLWPLIDYRESPRENFRNLSILGPIFKFQLKGESETKAVRPLFFQTTDTRSNSSATDYLYPLASSETAPEVETFQFLKVIKSNTYHKNEAGSRKDSMFFPFYISGESEKYGAYTSIFPFYGDIYQRFWRDEYHFILFPLYGRTVNKGTTTRHYLYPFFSSVEGERETGFQFWPLYGQAKKDGVYSTRFVLWPFFFSERRALDTDNPTSRLFVLPFYVATDSPGKEYRSYLWPFFGYSSDFAQQEHETDYFWPLVYTVRGRSRNVTSLLPFYAEDREKETVKRWYAWPFLKHEEMASPSYRQERNRILYYLYSDNREQWPKDGRERRRMALWPLFLYKSEPNGVQSLSMPAPVEPVFDREGIERNWAPLWRLYYQRWNENGDSAVSFLWNLYWHEMRGEAIAYELFPLVEYHSENEAKDLKLLKGLIRYRSADGRKALNFLWLPFSVKWETKAAAAANEITENARRGRQ